MKDLKLGFQFLKYAYGRKGVIACAVVSFVLGIPICIVDILEAINSAGGYFFLLAAMMPCQGLISLYASDLVMASPARRRLEIAVYTMMQFAGSIVSYLMVLVIGGIVAVCSPGQIRNVCSQLILTAVFAVTISLYLAACRKYFTVSTIIVILVFIFLEAFTDVEWWLPSMEDGWGLFAGVVLMGMALIVCSGGLLYLLNIVLYKAPMSKLSQTAGLRRSL